MLMLLLMPLLPMLPLPPRPLPLLVKTCQQPSLSFLFRLQFSFTIFAQRQRHSLPWEVAKVSSPSAEFLSFSSNMLSTRARGSSKAVSVPHFYRPSCIPRRRNLRSHSVSTPHVARPARGSRCDLMYGHMCVRVCVCETGVERRRRVKTMVASTRQASE
jgi:hypothetical protein